MKLFGKWYKYTHIKIMQINNNNTTKIVCMLSIHQALSDAAEWYYKASLR